VNGLWVVLHGTVAQLRSKLRQPHGRALALLEMKGSSGVQKPIFVSPHQQAGAPRSAVPVVYVLAEGRLVTLRATRQPTGQHLWWCMCFGHCVWKRYRSIVFRFNSFAAGLS
jgi:hypothetical protein